MSDSTHSPRLKLAIQKSGRLAEESADLLERCGIRLRRNRDQLFCRARNFPLDVFFVRDDDIPAFVSTGVCHAGIVGENVLLEERAEAREGGDEEIEIVTGLGFGRCRLSLAIPGEREWTNTLNGLAGKHIATSYPGILSDWLDRQGVTASIVNMQGAVEIAPRTGMAEVICDLVSTGGTLAMNGLKEVEILLESQAVLIRGKPLDTPPRALLDRLLMRIQGVRRAANSKYIMLHAPVAALDAIKAGLPGSEAPTVVPLQGSDERVAVHAVCDEEVFWDVMEDLESKGATSILVLPIEKMLG